MIATNALAVSQRLKWYSTKVNASGSRMDFSKRKKLLDEARLTPSVLQNPPSTL